MTEKPTRRRRLLLVLLLGMGVAAWVIRSRLVERRPLREGWPPLPPRPVAAVPDPVDAPPAPLPDGAAEADAQLAPAAEAADAQRAPAEAEPAPSRVRAVPAAAAVASVAAPALPTAPPGSVRANDDGSAPEAEYVVKGKTATRVFYAPGSPYYSRTRADVWFRTDDDARAAGFTPRAPRRSS
jgi:hypothetical protein